jgi:hypothetical protein
VVKFTQLDLMEMAALEMEQKLEQMKIVQQLNKFYFLKIFLLLMFVVVLVIVYQFLIKMIFTVGEVIMMANLEMVMMIIN